MSIIAGIDLGTTFSALGILNTIGKPEIVPNGDGERLTPSAIFFDEENPDVIRVGVEAINSRHLNAERSVRWIKRHIGDTDFKKIIDDKKWSPIELSSLILKKLKQECNTDNHQIKNVAISVPAHFDEIRRKATMDAGKMAGLNVIAIVNEPVAAALYYATSRQVAGKVLVYDLGGGTFDVTILNISGKKVDIICSQGDHALGGIDFDNEILKILEKMYRDKFDTDLITNAEERAKYEDEAEDIKKTLSRRPVAKKMLYGPSGSLRVEITREQFEQAIAELIGRTEILMEVALEESNLKTNDIDTVLLVGGSTRIPLVQQKLENMFDKSPECAVNVDECVALGATIYAGLTMLREHPDSVNQGIKSGLGDVKLTDVCNHSYGTICAPIDKETGKRVIQNHIMLKKNSVLPCYKEQMFYTMNKGQTNLEIAVTQGEDKDVKFVNTIARHKLNLPPNRDAECPIKVRYSYDLNQRMHCQFEDMQSGKLLDIDLEMNNNGQATNGLIEEKVKQLQAYEVK